MHLADWPDADLFPANPALVEAMDRIQQICSTGSSLRKAANLRVRLPLQELTVVAPGADALDGFAAVVADELNLRSVRLLDADSASPEEFGIEQKLVVNARAAGPRLGKNVQQAIKGSKSGDWSVDDAGVVTAGGLALEPQEYTLETVVAEAAEGDGSPRGGRPARRRLRGPQHRGHAGTGSRRCGPGHGPRHPAGPQGRRTQRQRPDPHHRHRHARTSSTPCWPTRSSSRPKP